MDSNRLKVFRITDYAIAMHVIKNPAIEESIHEDGCTTSLPDLIDEYWVGVTLDGIIIGCFQLSPQGQVAYQIHTMFLPGYRKHALVASDLFGKWCLDNIAGIEKMFAMIPKCFENVAKHCLSKGFKHEGTIIKAYLRNGKLEDILIYGISRKQIMENTKWVE